MNKQEAQDKTKKANSELFSLSPSALITLFEIDINDIAFDAGLITESDNLNLLNNTIFRFHNNIKLINNNIFWKGQEYIAAPISAEGFETITQGTLPTPKLSISVNREGIESLSIFKDKIKSLGDLVGGKVTRIRTFLKYLDRENFINKIVPDDFDPDNKVELLRDIYFIDRKSGENKYAIEFELGSILDIQGIKLPLRIVSSNKCLWSYRGNGCLFEYNTRRVELIHGKPSESILPDIALPVATSRDEKIRDIINKDIVDKGKWEPNTIYSVGHAVYIEKNGIKYYFVAKIDNPPKPPPNLNYWISEQCSKTITGCKLRWSNIGNGTLPFGGEPGVSRVV